MKPVVERKGPLRAVVALVEVELSARTRVWRERLECGHIVGIKHDFYGETTARKRRCWKCRDARPLNITTEEILPQ